MFKRKYKLKENIFDKIDRNVAYWLGFMYGDGNCTCENKIRLALRASDYEHLVKFRNFIGSDDRPIKKYVNSLGHDFCGFEFRSWKMHNSIKKYELNKRKENRGRLHLDLIQDNVVSDFVRGLFDADGTFFYSGIHKNHLFSEITGRKALLQDIKNILVRFKVISENKKIVKNGSIFRIRMANSDTIKFMDFIYAKEPRYFLSRKYGLAKNYLERLNDTTHKSEAIVQF
jgi:hypothetical protein